MYNNNARLPVKCQLLSWVGVNPSTQDDPSNWCVVCEWVIDHNRKSDRVALGKTCREAFENGQRVHTWALMR